MRRPSLFRVMVGAFAVVVLLATPPAGAHTPIQDGRAHDSAADALFVADPDLSQVAYQPMDNETAFWLAMDLRAGQSVYVQLGTPQIARLAEYVPALALVGKGLGHDRVPFAVPPGARVTVLPAAAPPERFYEMFTGTDSFIWVTKTWSAPKDGRYYVVAFAPPTDGGKLWVAIGQREQFGVKDIVTYHDTLVAVRAFHEVPMSPLPPLPAALDFLSQFFRLLGVTG